MSFYPGDPKQRFPHPANAEVLAVLEALSAPLPTNPEDIFREFDDYELHTHPELYDRLLKISRNAETALDWICFKQLASFDNWCKYAFDYAKQLE
ncbi:MAG: hypothetical protein ABIY70_21370 [Capsulimonas sp.]|uniref:hypothetical protein n=1 Tax=Capsulimonas sp. TaxID=2494211 RepID=UPI003265EB2D